MPGLDRSMTGGMMPAIVARHMLTFLHAADVSAAERQDFKVLTGFNELDDQAHATFAGAM